MSRQLMELRRRAAQRVRVFSSSVRIMPQLFHPLRGVTDPGPGFLAFPPQGLELVLIAFAERLHHPDQPGFADFAGVDVFLDAHVRGHRPIL